MAVQLWLSAQEANSNSLHLDIRVLTLKFASFENRLCAITPVSAIFLLLAWSRPNPTDWSSFLLATRLPAPLPGWSTCRCRCFCQWYGHLDDRSKSLTRSPTAVCPLLPDLHIAPPPRSTSRLGETVHRWSAEQSWMCWMDEDTSYFTATIFSHLRTPIKHRNTV